MARLITLLLALSFYVSAQEPQELLYEGVPLEVSLAAVNPATQELAVALRFNPVIIWDTESQGIVREFADAHPDWQSLTFSPDGSLLAGGGYDGSVVIYDAATGEALNTQTVESPAESLSFSSDGGELLVNGRWVVDTRSYVLTSLDETNSGCTGEGGAYLPGSSSFFTAGYSDFGSPVCMWDADSHTFVKEVTKVEGQVGAVEASPAGDTVVVTSETYESFALLIDASGSARSRLRLGQASGTFREANFSADGTLLVLTPGAVAAAGRKVVIVEPLSGQVVNSYDESTLATPLNYSINGSALLDADTLVLLHSNAGLSFVDLTNEVAQAQEVRKAEVQRLAQAEVTRAQQEAELAEQEAEAGRQEAERQAQEQEEARREVEAAEQAEQEQIMAQRQFFTLARDGTAEEIAAALTASTDLSVSVTDEFGQTPLMYAAGHNEPVVVRLLVNLGADVNQVTDEGWTALMYAARDNTLEMVETLVELGAEVNAVNDDGDTALELASAEPVRDHLTRQITSGQGTEGGALDDPAPENEVREQEASGTEQRTGELTSAEQTIFDLARDGTASELIEVLTSLDSETFGQNPELQAMTNEEGMTPLMVAASHNDVVVVQLLISSGANVNQKTDDGWTALMFAAKNGRMDIIDTLTQFDVNLLATNDAGQTFLDVAAADIREDIVTGYPGFISELKRRQTAREAPRKPSAAPARAQPPKQPQQVKGTATLVTDVFAADLFREVTCMDAAYDVANNMGAPYSDLRCAEVSGTMDYLETAVDYQIEYGTEAAVTFNGPFGYFDPLYVKSVILGSGELLFLAVPQGRVTQYLIAFIK